MRAHPFQHRGRNLTVALALALLASCGDDAAAASVDKPVTGLDSGVDALDAALRDAASPQPTRDAAPAHDASVSVDAGRPAVWPEASLDDGASGSSDASAVMPGPVTVPTPQTSGCVTDVSAGQHEFDCDGITQQVTVPALCLTTQCGLIIDVHGGTMSAKMEDKNTQLAALGQKHGYVVLQPSAALGLWTAGTDDAKILTFLQSLISVFQLDPKRVHMTGLSQGGYMTWRFICQHGELLASAAPAAASGTANISLETDCSFTGTDKPSVELPILYMHGTTDGLVDFSHALIKRDAVIATYGLGAGVPLVKADRYRRTRYQNARGTVFEFLDHDYQSSSVFPAAPPAGIALKGHCFPGSMDWTVTEPGQLMSFGCDPPTDFNWGEEVIAFFMAHPKP